MDADQQNNNLLMTERDFHDEIFQEIQSIKESDLNNPFKKVFDFGSERRTWLANNPGLNEVNQFGMYKYPLPIAERCRSFINKLERMKISSFFLCTKADSFTISLTPKLFIDFYNRKYGTQLKNEEKNILVKNKKRITLPKFRREEWSKISIKFLDDRNFLLSDPRDTKPCSPESIGCLDERTQKPDDAWEFLMRVAKGKGITDPINKIEREKQKKHKQKITDILRTIFENDTDPFEKEKGGVYKAKFSISYIEDNRPKIKEKKEYLDLEKVRKEMTGE